MRSWERNGRRGMVEAVTGTGKTMLGLVAAQQELERGGRVLVLTPTVELQQQWQHSLETHLGGARIGLLGDGKHDSLDSSQVLVSIVNSARDAAIALPPEGGLLVADECHRYGAERNAAALKDVFPRRLALSATYDRSDDGIATWVEPFFGGCCFKMGYPRALRDDVVAHFKVALIGVDFAPSEAQQYQALSLHVSRFKKVLIHGCGVPEEPFGEFMKQVTELTGTPPSPCRQAARGFLNAFTKRRELLAETPSKLEGVGCLGKAIAAAERTLVFTQTIKAAQRIADLLCSQGEKAAAIHSETQREERRSVLQQFGTGVLRVVVAPQVLDEGIDVPDADLAVIVAASRSRRQMIQRMGRVLRRKRDGRLARFAVQFVAGTSEDPANGAHEAFLREITDVADDVRQFSVATDAALITGYLNEFASKRPESAPRAAGQRRPFLNRHALF